MVMTKKERQYVEQLERRLRVMGALRWTWPVTKDVPVPQGSDEATSGWTFNSFTGSVQPAWSNVAMHGVGSAQRIPGVSARQHGIAMYSSRLLALRAMRHAVESTAADQLADIDTMIEAEERGSA